MRRIGYRESRDYTVTFLYTMYGTASTRQNRIFFRIFFIRKFNTTKPNHFRMYLPKSDVSDFVTEKILENYKPENVKIGYFRRKTVYFRSLLTLLIFDPRQPRYHPRYHAAGSRPGYAGTSYRYINTVWLRSTCARRWRCMLMHE